MDETTEHLIFFFLIIRKYSLRYTIVLFMIETVEVIESATMQDKWTFGSRSVQFM